MADLIRHLVGFGHGPHPAYYERIDPPEPSGRHPVVMIHGGAHTGSCFQRTVDGRPGWAYRFAEHGYPTVVVDWPGHGRSGAIPAEAVTGELVCRSLAGVLDVLGVPVVLLTHSMGGALGWRLMELRAAQIAGVVAAAPGPPGNIQAVPEVLRETPSTVVVETANGPREISRNGLTTMARARVDEKLVGASTRFPSELIDRYAATLTSYSSRLVYERSNVHGSQVALEEPACLAGKHVLVLTGSADLDHPRAVDGAIVDWIVEHGGMAEHLWLEDLGVTGNGHMLMMEENSDEVAEIVLRWLDRTICTPPAPEGAGRPAWRA